MKLTSIWVPSIEMTLEEYKALEVGDTIKGMKIQDVVDWDERDEPQLKLDGEVNYRVIVITRSTGEKVSKELW